MKRIIMPRFLLAALAFCPLMGFGQANTLSQNFETTQTATSLGYTNTGSTIQSGNANTVFQGGTVTPNTSVGISNSRGCTVSNNTGSGLTTAIVNFDNTRVVAGSATTFSFRLASFRIGNNNGLSNDGSIVVSLSSDGTTNFTAGNILTLTGPAGNPSSAWDYNATGSYNGIMGNLPAVAQVVPNGAGGYSTVTITLPATASQILVRITLNANDKDALAVDNIVLNSNQPLPVELTAFEAIRQSGAVLLKWATASEKDNDRFEVQRSIDGQDFALISTVRGQGTTTQATTYSIKDEEPLAGTSYYRLRQLDTDGTASYSPVRVVQATLDLAYPSPTYDVLNLPITAVGSSYRVCNVLGQVLLQGIVPTSGAVDVQRLAKGTHLLITGIGHNQFTQRFVRE